MIGLSPRASASRILPAFLLLVAARPVAEGGEIQPDRLHFGRVHVGARVQGSVRIFVEPKAALELKAKVEPPKFVKIESIDQGTQEYGTGNLKGYCDLSVTVVTTRAGEFSAPVIVTLGDRRIEVPVSASIKPRDEKRPRLLVLDTPFDKFSTSDAKLFDPWLALVEKAGLDVDYREAHTGGRVLSGVDPADYDAILLAEGGITGLKDADYAALKTFADGGGCIILTANYFYRGTVEKANQLLVPYGLKMEDSESPTMNAIEIRPPQIPPGPLTEGVESLSFHRASPSKVLDPERTMVIVPSPGEPDKHLVAMALAGERGRIVSIGESLWWIWVGKADNGVLMANLLPKRHRPK